MTTDMRHVRMFARRRVAAASPGEPACRSALVVPSSMEGARTDRRYGRSSHSQRRTRRVLLSYGAPNCSCRNRSWAGSAGIDVAPEVMKALTKVDPTYRDHALTELRPPLQLSRERTAG
jgi:hypothetical protein